MSPSITLDFNNGYLRPLKRSDVHPGYIKGLNDSDVNRYLEVRHFRQTRQSVINFVLANEEASNAVLWGVWVTGCRNHVGTVRIHNIDHLEKKAVIGICLFEKSIWGHGIGSVVIRKVTQWAFESEGVRFVEAGVYMGNIASKKTFLGAGYLWARDLQSDFEFEGKPARVSMFVSKADVGAN